MSSIGGRSSGCLSLRLSAAEARADLAVAKAKEALAEKKRKAAAELERIEMQGEVELKEIRTRVLEDELKRIEEEDREEEVKGKPSSLPERDVQEWVNNSVNPPVDNKEKTNTTEKTTNNEIIRDYLTDRQRYECEKLVNITPPILNDETKPIDISKVFTDLQLMDGSETNTRPMTLTEVMGKIANSYRPKVLITGEGGMGKTTLLHFIAYRWASDNENVFKSKLLFLINIRDIPKTVGKDFVDAIMEESGIRHAEEKRNLPKGSIKRFLRSHSDEIVLLLDGLDELQKGAENPSKLFTDYDLSGYTVLLTSRPDNAIKITHKCDIHVKVLGFNSSNVEIYIHKYFDFYKKIDSGNSLIERLQSLKYNNTLQLCSSPHLLLMVCTMWKESESLPRDLAELYENVFFTILNQYSRRSEGITFSRLKGMPDEYENAILTLGQSIYLGLLTNNLLIDKEDMLQLHKNETIVNLALKIGFVYKENPKSNLGFKQIYTTSHKLLSEALAAFYICIRSIKDPLNADEYETLMTNEYLHTTKVFTIGFLGRDASELLQQWLKIRASNYYTIAKYFSYVKPIHKKYVLQQLNKNMSKEVKQHVKSMTDSFRIFYRYISGEKNEDKNSHLIEFIKTFCDAVNDRHLYITFSKNMSTLIKTSNQPCNKMCRVISHISLIEKVCAPLDTGSEANDTYILQMISKFGNESIEVLSSEWKLHSLGSEVHSFSFNNCDLRRSVTVAQFCRLLRIAPRLEHLSVVNCNLSGEFLNEFIQLYGISGFQKHDLNITPIDRTIVPLSLRTLDVSHNDLSNLIGKLFSKSFREVDKLVMNYCNLSGSIVGDILNQWDKKDVLKCKIIEVKGNNLSNIDDKLLTFMNTLNHHLYLKWSDYNFSVQNILDLISQCSEICKFEFISIDLNGVNLSSLSLPIDLHSFLKIFPNMGNLYLSNCSLTGNIFDVIDMTYATFGQVKKEISYPFLYLDISHNNLNNVNVTSFRNSLVMFHSLIMEYCNITGTMVEAMFYDMPLMKSTPDFEIIEDDDDDIIIGEKLINLFIKRQQPTMNKFLITRCDYCKLFARITDFSFTYSDIDFHKLNRSLIVDNWYRFFLSGIYRLKNCTLRNPIVGDIPNVLCLLSKQQLSLKGNDLSNINGKSLYMLIKLIDEVQPQILIWSDYSLSANNLQDLLRKCNSGCRFKSTYIDLSNTNLSLINISTLSTLLNNFPKIKTLKLDNCSSTGTIIVNMLKQQIVPLSLSTIDLSHNNLQDINVVLFSKSLMNVNTIFMRYCNLTGTMLGDMLNEWEKLDALKHKNLALRANDLSNINGKSLIKLLNVLNDYVKSYFILREYNLKTNNLQDLLTLCNNDCEFKFVSVDLGNTNLSLINTTTLANLFNIFPNINTLNLENCSLTGSIVNNVLKYEIVPLSLSKIDLSDNNLGDIDTRSLTESLKNVDKIILEYCNLTGTMISDILNKWKRNVLKKKQILARDNDLSNINGKSLVKLMHALSNYYEYSCFRLSDYNLSTNNLQDFLTLCKNCRFKFTLIDLRNTDLSLINETKLEYLFKIFPNMDILILSNCSLTGTILSKILNNISEPLSLSWINLSYNNLGDIDAASLFRLLRNVDEKIMRNCKIRDTYGVMLKKWYYDSHYRYHMEPVCLLICLILFFIAYARNNNEMLV